MKSVALFLVLTTTSLFAASAQDCLKENDSIDRKYCMDKYLSAVKKQQDAEKQTWNSGLTPEVKSQKSEMLAQEIANKKDYINLLNQEMAATQKHLEDLNSAAVAAKAPEAPKKKKKKGGFRIKL